MTDDSGVRRMGAMGRFRTSMALVLLALCSCADDDAAPPDAFDARFGGECRNPGFSPLATCSTPVQVVGWCVIAQGASIGVCQRACVRGVCPDGQTPTPFFDATHCYCMP